MAEKHPPEYYIANGIERALNAIGDDSVRRRAFLEVLAGMLVDPADWEKHRVILQGIVLECEKRKGGS